MKRKELIVGMRVEIRDGRDYPMFTEAIILTTDPWVKDTVGGFRTRFRAAQRSWDSRSGVAVAKHRSDGDGTEWVPRVVQLQTIVPVGTKAAWEAERKRKQQTEVARRHRSNTRRGNIAGRLGVDHHWVTFSTEHETSVTVPTAALEAALGITQNP